MSHLSVRQCHLLIAETLVDAQHCLHNQNRWLGRELNHTLLYFDEHTGINQLLSVWGCVRGGCYFVMAHPRPLSCKSYFYRTINYYQLLHRLYSYSVNVEPVNPPYWATPLNNGYWLTNPLFCVLP